MYCKSPPMEPTNSHDKNPNFTSQIPYLSHWEYPFHSFNCTRIITPFYFKKLHQFVLISIGIFSKRMGGEAIVVPLDSLSQPASLIKKTAVSRSWISVDPTGQSTILDLDKYGIMKRVSIHARDLRILDPLLSYPSAILGREKAIVLNLEHIKAIITTEESFKEEFPFEFRALEVALEGICSFLDARTRELETAAYPALDELTSKISSRNLDRVRKLKSAMTRLTNRVQKVRDELEQLLDDDDDMADLYLSRKLSFASSASSDIDGAWSPPSPTIESKISRASRATPFSIHGENDVEELEMLLEAYFMQIEATSNKLTTLELFLLSGTVSLSVYSLVAAIFGMNIPYPWNNNHGYVFKWVVVFAAIVSGSVFMSIMTYSRHKGLVGS
ncbi:Magnesium transporter MRS2/LPE10 [Cynara cardunculus var. scolymus]|uniref:Magnesium transporter n=1 Tax=Cynara cardunculus var. scolymus TaxID=59895 RepID=A0A103XP97_CYNCS|nr:Magnesium transporter MRS2/LPE10 [Cynara cardunculus var. scolymus]